MSPFPRRIPHDESLVVALLAHAPRGLGLLGRGHALGHRTEGRALPLRRGVRAHLGAQPAHLVHVRVRVRVRVRVSGQGQGQGWGWGWGQGWG